MSNQFIEPTIFLDQAGPSKHVFVLDHKSNKFLNIRVSTAKEVYGRNYKDILNSFMIFSIDCCIGFNSIKSNKTFKQFSYSPKDISYLWENSPKEVKDEYEQVFVGFKNLKPKGTKFISCNPQEKETNTNENFNNEPNIEHLHNNSITEENSSDTIAFNYVEENGIIPNLGYPEYSPLLYSNTLLNDDASQYMNNYVQAHDINFQDDNLDFHFYSN